MEFFRGRIRWESFRRRPFVLWLCSWRALYLDAEGGMKEVPKFSEAPGTDSYVQVTCFQAFESGE